MGKLSRLFSRRAAPPSPGLGAYSFPAFSAFSSYEIALNSTVQACGNIIANSVSILPLNLYFRNPTDGSRAKAGWMPVYNVVKNRPNLTETPVIFYGRVIRDILQKGNCYLWKNYLEGQVVSLHRLVPEGVVERYQGIRTFFRYAGQEYEDGPDCPIMRITSLIVDDNGKGFSPLTFAKTAVQLGIQLDEYSLSSFGNGLNTKLIIDIADATKDMDEDAAAAYARTVSEYVRANYTGSANAGKPYIQFLGKATEIKGQSSNRDAELLESRKWQELEICKIFGVPPFLVNGSYDIKYGNLEAAMTVFVNFSLSPYLLHIAQRFNSLLTAYEQGAYYFEFDFSKLLRADASNRSAYYSKMFSMGAMSPDDIAASENLEPDPNGAGSMRYVPAQNMPLTKEVQDAYMADAKIKAAGLGSGGAGSPPDPALAAGSQAQ
jgi:HK97 family phage portal protein